MEDAGERRADEPLMHRRVRMKDESKKPVRVFEEERRREGEGRKRAEEALQESEAKYRGLVEQAVDGVIIVQDGMFKFANEGMAEITGYTVEEMEGMPFLDMVVPELRDVVAQRFTSRMAGEQLAPAYETKIRCKDGTAKEVEARSRTIQHQGKPANLSIVRDVTERKLMEEALQESERRYRLLAENASDVIYLTDTELRPTYVSPSIMRLVGYSAEEVMSHGLDELLTPASLEVALQALAEDQAIESAGQKEQYRSQPLEMELRCKDGSTVWEETRLTFLRDPDGQIAGYLGVMRDITERKRVEEALQKKTHDLGERVKELDCLYGISRLVGRQGVSLKEILQGAVDLISAACQHPDITCTRIILEDQEFRTDSFRETVWRQASDIFVHGVSVGAVEVFYLEEMPESNEGPFLREERSLIDTIARQVGGITERKRAEQNLQQAYEEELRLRRELDAEMSKRVEFLRALVHELKTPLTSAMASSEMLSAGLPKGPALTLAKNLYRSTSRLNKRIDELLDLARGELGMLHLSCRPTDMLPLLQGVFDDMTTVVSRRGQELALDVPSSLPLIWADEQRLSQVVLNLLSNASKFMAGEGKITLRARKQRAALIVEVQDAGPGIGKEEQQSVFDAYHRLAGGGEHSSGLGLGLALSKTLVELHEGTIWVKSRKGKGSTFGFSLPLHAAIFP